VIAKNVVRWGYAIFTFLELVMVMTRALKDQDLSFSPNNIPYYEPLGINDRYFCYSWVSKGRNLTEVHAEAQVSPCITKGWPDCYLIADKLYCHGI